MSEFNNAAYDYYCKVIGGHEAEITVLEISPSPFVFFPYQGTKLKNEGENSVQFFDIWMNWKFPTCRDMDFLNVSGDNIKKS